VRDPKKHSVCKDGSPSDLTRRDFVALSLAASLLAGHSAPSAELPVSETDVEVKTPDGTCDAAFFHPTTGTYPGVLLWPDSNGLRPALRELGQRLAAEGYSVFIPNHLYRLAKAPVFDKSFNPVKNPGDKEKYSRITAPFFAPGAVERDAVAYVAFLDAQRQVDKKKKIGTQGYCLGGWCMMKTVATLPDRVGAGASFHGGLLVTDQPDSVHLLAPKIKARLYFAVASDDDKRQPEVKEKLKEAFAGAKVNAEIELYPNALHGWCVPDNKPASENKADAERAWSRLIALYKAAL
jgi:carboxymethylenebutenolidase